MAGSKKSTFLEVNSAILENKLLIKDSSEEGLQDYQTLLGLHNDSDAPWILAIPKPGFCVKTYNSNKEKIFINVCTIPDIPEPKDITEDELVTFIEQEQESQFRVPLSLAEPREEFDKSGKKATVFDVAINPKFYQKIQQSQVFKTFLLQLIMYGVKDKYNVDLDFEDCIILKNRTNVGDLRSHRIRTKPSVPQNDVPKKKLIQEITEKPVNEDIQIKKEVSYRLMKKKEANGQEYLIGQFYIPRVVSANDIVLEVGEDRIIFQSHRANYLLDIFLPISLNSKAVYSEFLPVKKVLTVWIGISS